jgi:hypothetical protein
MKQRPIVSLWALLLSHRVPSKDNEPFTKKEMERSRGPADIQNDAADLKSELIKLAFGASQTSLKLVNWVWELETPHSVVARGDR